MTVKLSNSAHLIIQLQLKLGSVFGVNGPEILLRQQMKNV